jgi:uncharacterized membrane protein YgaE (UPF0421/DUF939 family)
MNTKEIEKMMLCILRAKSLRKNIPNNNENKSQAPPDQMTDELTTYIFICNLFYDAFFSN